MRAGCFVAMLAVIGFLTPTTAAAQSVAKGRDLATSRCASCHALDPAGASPHKDAPPFRDIARRYPIAGLAEAFAEGITVGHEDMPEFILQPAEIDDLLAFMATLGRQQ